MVLILIVLFVLVLAGAPGIGFSHQYGIWPSGLGGLVLIVLLVLLLTNRGRL